VGGGENKTGIATDTWEEKISAGARGKSIRNSRETEINRREKKKGGVQMEVYSVRVWVGLGGRKEKSERRSRSSARKKISAHNCEERALEYSGEMLKKGTKVTGRKEKKS